MPQPSLTETFKTPAKIAQIQRRLVRWFRTYGRDLPWRGTNDPYAILVSEIMLQQTPVTTVLPYYERWLERFPDFSSLAAATESQVLHAWQGLGYYSRARHLHAAAKSVVRHFNGQLPINPLLVRQLPGIGRYTAGAIASFAYNQPEPIVEANSARVLARLTNCTLPIDSSTGRACLWQAATKLLPPDNSSEHNSALIDLGALICLPRKPRCDICPVRWACRAPQPETLPVKKARLPIVRVKEYHVFARHGDKVLLSQSQSRWRGMWILPRVTRPRKARPILKLEFAFTHHLITLVVLDSPLQTSPNEHEKWFPIGQLAVMPIPNPHRRALNHLLGPAH
jgi:A/G-specific adenine glycosylase